MQKHVNLVDLVKSFPTSIYLQKSASIQPRTNLSKSGEKFNSLFIRLLRWNPAVESQAIQRAHRIGQKTAVRAVRFVMEGTLEENMLALQKKKQAAFDATVGREGSAMEKLTEDDIRFLFGFQ